MDSDTLDAWVGSTQDTEDTLQLSVCEHMAATVGTSSLAAGDPLPPLWHWLFFHDVTPSAETGDDGHARRGGFLPPVALPRRMWAGGRLRFYKPLLIGSTVHKHSKITRVEHKQGKSGSLCFVTVLHTFKQSSALSDGSAPAASDGVLMEEEHDIVYREAAQSQPLSSEQRDALRSRIKPAAQLSKQLTDNSLLITPSVNALFRYSALTFNGHRIHYDRDYCQRVEHYDGLVFHGPLTATLMANFAQARLQQDLASFEFRALQPLFDTDTFTIDVEASENGLAVFARKKDGSVAMQASAAI